MGKNEITHPEIYIGSLIEHGSEKKILHHLVSLLKKRQRSSVVFANISIASRQVDFVVAFDYLALVIEAKGISRPVRGGENGDWQVQVASGSWKDFRNPYVQARDAALAVKDVMGSFAAADVPYPTAAVIFVPEIPRGSGVYKGDFKVSVVGLNDLHALLEKRQKNPWPLNRWREFAKHLQLTPVSTVAAACDPMMAEAEDLLRRYTAEFCRTYTSPEPLVAFTCQSDGEAISSENVARLVSEEHADILIRGPSGCGKSLLAAHIGVEFSRRDGIAITIPVKDYTGNLKTILSREAGLLAATSPEKLLNLAHRLNRPVLLIADGYNECAEQKQFSLTQGLAALAGKYEASILVTSQIPLARGDLLALRTIEVPSATMETKVAIAKNSSGGGALPGEIERLLGAVSTGLEARLIGEIGRQLGPGSSRYALFDAYARKKLGGSARDGIRTLSEIAAWLSKRIAFSLSVREFDRLMDRQRVPHALPTLLQTTRLLALRGDKVSFAHEMFFNAFAAEAVVRHAADRFEAVLTALAAPQHAERQDFIIGAIDDDLLLEQVLEKLTDHACIARCLSGACGLKPQEWAEARCLRLWEQLREKAGNVRFRICDQSMNKVAFETDCLATWSPSDRAFLRALPRLLTEGYYVNDILNVVGILDQRIDEEWERLHDEAAKRKIALRQRLFATIYTFSFDIAVPVISEICSHLHAKPSWRTASDAVTRIIERYVMGEALSPGQLYLLLMLSRGADIAAPLIMRALQTHWSSAPFHLRLELMRAAVQQQANEAHRASLVEVIVALPEPKNIWISSEVVDALRFLGGFESSEREHHAVVHEEIRQCLACPNEDDSCAMAYTIYLAQFDHPYSGAYHKVLSNLPYGERKQLWMMAAKGVGEFPQFLSWLLIDLARCGDPETGKIIRRWTTLPPTPRSGYHDLGEAIAVFVVAHICLGRLGCSLPEKQPTTDNPSAEALAACGALLYWYNRTDLDEKTKRDACQYPLSVLARHEQGAALNVIRCCEDALLITFLPKGMEHFPQEAPVERSIVSCFPAEVAEICRYALCGQTNQISYFPYLSSSDKYEDLKFAINVLAHHGNTTDLALLRRYAADPVLGTSAIAAVKTIEERSTAS